MLAYRKLHPKHMPVRTPAYEIKNVQIQTQSACNANCVFCPWIESWHHENHGIMPTEVFIDILHALLPFSDSIAQKGKICPYLMQEPFADKRMLDLISIIQDIHPNACIELSTNCSLLSPEKIHILHNLLYGKKHEIWVSHHGINKQTHEEIMKINHERATRNLIELIKTSKGKLNIKIRGSGSSRTGFGKHWFTHKEYIEYWQNMSRIHNFPMEWVDLDYFTYHDRAGTIHRSERLANANNFGVVREISKDSPFYCSRVDRWIHIMWNGDYRLCCMDYHGEVALPNISQVPLDQYLISPDYTKLFMKVTGLIDSEENFICKRCTSPGG